MSAASNSVSAPQGSTRVQVLKDLLASGVNVNHRDRLGRTLAHLVAMAGDVEAMQFLIACGADFNACDNLGQTPLHMAIVPALGHEDSASGEFSLLTRLCGDTWDRLRDAHEVKMTYGEETVTDNICLALKAANSPAIRVHKIEDKKEEGRTGVDVEIYVGNGADGWWPYFVQAKRVEVDSGRYSKLLYENVHGVQFELLEKHAHVHKAIPLYALYNFVTTASHEDHCHCPWGDELSVLGWSITPTSILRRFVKEWKIPTFDAVHKPPQTLPARCLLCSRIAASQQAKDNPLAGDHHEAIRLRTLPAHAAAIPSENNVRRRILGEWVVVIDTEKAFLPNCGRA